MDLQQTVLWDGDTTIRVENLKDWQEVAPSDHVGVQWRSPGTYLLADGPHGHAIVKVTYATGSNDTVGEYDLVVALADAMHALFQRA